MTRIACGSTIRRIVSSRVIPRACAASVCPSSTEMIPARAISAMYAASLRPSPSNAAPNCVITVFGSVWNQDGPNGTPSDSEFMTAGRLNQNSTCTRTGVPRKNQM